MFSALMVVAGCGGSSSLLQSTSPPAVLLTGKLLGGQSPLQDSAVQLYAAGSSGYGTGAQTLTSVVYTDENGDFSITGDYKCPSDGTLTYLVANSGNPGTGTNNPAILLISALGPCGNLSSSTYVVIDEVSTVASVWALAPFFGPGAQVGTSSTNSQGLVNAFANVNNLVNPSTGTAPGAAPPTSAVIPVSKINTLANILAACVNSSGSCDALFAAATPSSGSAPDNTLDAALDIARNPASNIAALFAIPLPSSPFQPTLATAPPDWTLAATYVGGGLDNPGSIALDAAGDVWTANYFNSVTKLSSTGQPLSTDAGFIGGGLNESYGIAVDVNGTVWVTDEESLDGVNDDRGSLTVFNASDQVTSGADGYFAGGVFFPVAVATDTDGSVWTANNGNSTASKLSDTGSPITGSPFGVDQLVGPVAVAIDAGHNAWFANQSSDLGSVTEISANGSQVTTIDSGGNETSGIATDAIGISGGVSKGHVWTANYESSTVSELELNNNGTVTVVSAGYTGGGLEHPNGIAVDGAGNVWVTDYRGNRITELQGANGADPGGALSPVGGFGQDANLLEPYGVAIDASGNVWVSNFGSSTITEFVGAATPVKTPLAGPAMLP
ncbi:MAG: NHL repeat-containing protein [Terracidiphilus sp.]